MTRKARGVCDVGHGHWQVGRRASIIPRAMDATPPAADDDLDETPPFAVAAGDPARGLLLTCDHAENRLPRRYGTLGLGAEALSRHIAWDPGARAVTLALARRLGAPAVLSRFSRLLIDPNRGRDDPTLIMRLSDRAVIPGNLGVDAAERERRIAAFYAPYDAAIAAGIAAALAAGRPPAIVSIHSFTPVWRGRGRPWQVGVLWDADPRLAKPLIERLRADPELIVGDNEPYDGALAGDALHRHATARGLANVLIELRQDLIADDAGVAAWAERLAPILADINRMPGIHEIRRFGSRTGPVAPI